MRSACTHRTNTQMCPFILADDSLLMPEASQPLAGGRVFAHHRERGVPLRHDPSGVAAAPLRPRWGRLDCTFGAVFRGVREDATPG
jgi:hypothetical protein